MTIAGDPAVPTVDGSRAVSERVLIVEDDSAARVGLEQLVTIVGVHRGIGE